MPNQDKEQVESMYVWTFGVDRAENPNTINGEKR
jgi:hypothetical protein